MVAALGVGAAVKKKKPELTRKAREAEQAAWDALSYPYTVVLDVGDSSEAMRWKEVTVKDAAGEPIFFVRGGVGRHRKHAEGKSSAGAMTLKVTAYPDGEKVRTLYRFTLRKGRKCEECTLGNNYGHLARACKRPLTHMMVFDPPDWTVEMRPKDLGFHRTERTVFDGSKEIMKIEILSAFHLEAGITRRVLVNFDSIDDVFHAIMLGLAFTDVASA